MPTARGQQVYTVHQPPVPAADPLQRCEEIELIKEGFSWPAFIFGPLWLIARRMWLVLAGFAAVWLAVQLCFMVLPGGANAAGLAWLVISLGFGMEANQLRRWTLERRGYRTIGVVVGNSLIECEHRFFLSWPDATTAERAVPTPPPVPSSLPQPPPSDADMASRIRGIAEGMRRDLVGPAANPSAPRPS
jgi:hypothetical protein